MVRLNNGTVVPEGYCLLHFSAFHLCVICGLMNKKCVCNVVHPVVTSNRYKLIIRLSGTYSDN
jgi:hypothetical protein